MIHLKMFSLINPKLIKSKKNSNCVKLRNLIFKEHQKLLVKSLCDCILETNIYWGERLSSASLAAHDTHHVNSLRMAVISSKLSSGTISSYVTRASYNLLAVAFRTCITEENQLHHQKERVTSS